MNRQLKRANEKSEKRREREQEKRKTQRQASRILRSANAQAKPAQKRKADSSPVSSPRPTPAVMRPWFIRLYLLFSLLIILSQAVVPQRTDAVSLIVQGFFYLTLGYSLCLWLYGRGTERAFVFTLVGGVLLALLVEGLKYVIPGPEALEPGFTLEPNLLLVAIAVPGLALGAWLGQLIYRRR